VFIIGLLQGLLLLGLGIYTLVIVRKMSKELKQSGE